MNIYTFINKKNIVKDGTTLILIKVVYNKTRTYFSTGIRVKVEDYDQEQGRVLKKVKGSSLMNSVIEQTIVRYKNKILEYESLHGRDSCKDIKALLSDEVKQKELFVDYFKRKVEGYVTIAEKSKDLYMLTLSYVKDFAPMKHTAEVDVEFVTQFYNYMTHVRKRKLEVNGAAIHLRNLRAICNMAIKDGKMKEYPFKHFKIPTKQTEPKHLVETELYRLQLLYNSGELSDRLQNTLKHFLRSCYCGLRISDIRNLKSDMFDNDGYMNLTTQKRKIVLRVPINKRILELMPPGFDFSNDQPIKMSNSRVADDLNEILNMVGIKKKISFHTSRHTFAVVSLQKGVPLEVLQNLMGHRNIKTTQIYAKVVDSLKRKYMDLWDN